MRPCFIWCLVLALVLFVTLPALAQGRYAGVKVCARCHDAAGQQSPVHAWRESGHARAIQTLESHTEREPRKWPDLELWIVEMGNGEKYGLPWPAAKAKHCLPCHGTAFGADPARIGPGFDPAQGVQCEACHGPGSDHAEAMTRGGADPSAGLRGFENEAAIRARCQTCHDGMCGPFDFAAMWPKVRHVSPPVR
jgi:DnaJ-class molecular chaperone